MNTYSNRHALALTTIFAQARTFVGGAVAALIGLSVAGCSGSVGTGAPVDEMGRPLDQGHAALAAGSAAAPAAGWTLDPDASFLSIITTKQTDIAEVHTFERYDVSFDDAGTATLSIDLSSVATNVELRDERLRNHLFEVGLYPAATAMFPVDTQALEALTMGQSVDLPVNVTLTLHGVSKPIDTSIWVTRVSDSRFTVATTKPLVINAMDYNMGTGIQTLLELTGLQSISAAVPVEFLFTFDQG